jgi:hypothetical protein
VAQTKKRNASLRKIARLDIRQICRKSMFHSKFCRTRQKVSFR